MNEVKFVGKRFKGAINIPENIDVGEGIKIYNQGWGHCFRKVIGFIRHNEAWGEDDLISFIKEQRNTSLIHRVIVSTKQSERSQTANEHKEQRTS